MIIVINIEISEVMSGLESGASSIFEVLPLVVHAEKLSQIYSVAYLYLYFYFFAGYSLLIQI